MDTRGGVAIGAGRHVPELTVSGRDGGPPTGVVEVVLNITAVGSTTGGFFHRLPAGESRPLASNLNFGPGETIPNLVIAKVGAGGKGVDLQRHRLHPRHRRRAGSRPGPDDLRPRFERRESRLRPKPEALRRCARAGGYLRDRPRHAHPGVHRAVRFWLYSECHPRCLKRSPAATSNPEAHQFPESDRGNVLPRCKRARTRPCTLAAR